MKILHFSMFIIYVMLITSCNHSPAYDTESTLNLAKQNRIELEKVLNHFRDSDKVAYESACFLIENMKFHKSKDIIIPDSSHIGYFKLIDSLYRAIFQYMSPHDSELFKEEEYESLRKELGEEFNRLPKPQIIHNANFPDAQNLSADFLIDNIEQALNIWRKNGYKYPDDFDFFKEFILPYRTTDEYQPMKRTDIHNHFYSLFEKATDIYEILNCYKNFFSKCRWFNTYTTPQFHLGMYDLYLPRFKMDCHNMTNWSCKVFRAQGIPCTYEFTPQLIDQVNRHFWCVSPDSAGILQPYSAPYTNLGEEWKNGTCKVGKVYRRTFGAQKNIPYFLAGKNEFIPHLFNTPLLNDQTFRYHQTVTLHLPIKERLANNLAYLCMWDNGELSVVGWGKIDHKKKEIVYEQVPLNILFFPVYFDDRTMLDIAKPFMIYADVPLKEISLPFTTNISQHNPKNVTIIRENIVDYYNYKPIKELKYITLNCDTTLYSNLHLLRKYPVKPNLKMFRQQLKGAVVLASNDRQKGFDTLLTIKETPHPYLQEYKLENSKTYRFYRLSTSNGQPVNIAHIEFLSSSPQGNPYSTPTSLPIFHKNCKKEKENRMRIKGIPQNTGRNSEYAFDEDIFTYADATSSIEIEFRHPVQIEYIRLLPRNANNMIVPNNSYMLMYYDNGWKEFKILYAEHNYLDFEHVPKATLYWLRNLTEGKEEFPFFYINNQQYFLHVDKLPDYE
ncbi:hypothetical protein H6A36_13705 [Phocaeicola coprocola]|nr:hypothetical protein [Phocaeicola coprocola]